MHCVMLTAGGQYRLYLETSLVEHLFEVGKARRIHKHRGMTLHLVWEHWKRNTVHSTCIYIWNSGCPEIRTHPTTGHPAPEIGIPGHYPD